MKMSITTSSLSDALETIEAFSDSGWAVSKSPTLTWSWKRFRVQFKSELVKPLKQKSK